MLIDLFLMAYTELDSHKIIELTSIGVQLSWHHHIKETAKILKNKDIIIILNPEATRSPRTKGRFCLYKIECIFQEEKALKLE